MAESAIQTCHASQSTIWWAKRRDVDAYLIFIPGGLKYEREPSQEIFGDDWYPEIEDDGAETMVFPSASKAKKHIFASKNRDAFTTGLDNLVLNPELLSVYMGVDERWTAVDDWKSRLSSTSTTKTKDDFELKLKINRVSKQRRAPAPARFDCSRPERCG